MIIDSSPAVFYAKFELLQKTLLDEVEQLDFYQCPLKDFRKVINSECFNYKVHNLSNIFISGDWLRKVEFKNISKIKPKKLHQIDLR